MSEVEARALIPRPSSPDRPGEIKTEELLREKFKRARRQMASSVRADGQWALMVQDDMGEMGERPNSHQRNPPQIKVEYYVCFGQRWNNAERFLAI